MTFKLNRLAAFVATLAIASSANAALTIYQPWETAYTGNGLSGVLFNVQTASSTANGVTSTATVAMGAHAYKNGVSLPNNGVDTYTGAAGLYETQRANWSFDFGWELTDCNQCSVWLGIDKDATAAVDLVWRDITDAIDLGDNISNPESWNMEMGFLTTSVYDFNPFAASSTGFTLQVRDGTGTGTVVAGSSITVNVEANDVPEPGSLALAGLALTGLAFVRRRRNK